FDPLSEFGLVRASLVQKRELLGNRRLFQGTVKEIFFDHRGSRLASMFLNEKRKGKAPQKCRGGQEPGGASTAARQPRRVNRGASTAARQPRRVSRAAGAPAREPRNATAQRQPRTASRNQARAKAQSRSAVVGEIPSTAAAWSLVRPAKKRSSTNCTFRGSSDANRVNASSRARSSSSAVGAA